MGSSFSTAEDDFEGKGSSFSVEDHSVTTTASNIHQSNNVFAHKLSKVLGPKHTISPFSISYIISLLHLASVENTEKQLTDLMLRQNQLEDLEKCSILFNNDIIKLANVVLVNKRMPIKEDYLQMCRKLALVSNEDFSDTDAIVEKTNSFIEENTNGLIKDLLEKDMINTDTVMVLVNTIYFKARWKSVFEVRNTRTEKFSDGSDVQMMTDTDNHSYYEDSKVQLIELLYKGSEYCMGIILPRPSADLKDCVGYLNKDVKRTRESVKVQIPKFTQRKKIDLIPHMQKLGVTDLFGQESRLDKMIEPLGDDFARVSTMIHEAVVIVDEEGTEASAATIATVMLESAAYRPKKPILFRADHPFIYYIKHIPTNTLLFVGDFHGI